jgi:hypothetical protein
MTDYNLTPTQQLNKYNLLFILIFILIFFLFCRLDLVSAVPTSNVIMILAYLLSRRRLVEGEAASLSVDGASNCHQNR